MKSKDFDFERANTLMTTIVEGGKHGPLYQKIAGWAAAELKEMMRAVDPDVAANPRVVTPAAGPANSMVEQKDGSYKRVTPAPLPSGVRDEASLAGELQPANPATAPARTDRPLDETRVPEAEQGLSIPTGNQALPNDQVVPHEAYDESEPLEPGEPIDRRL